MGRHGGSTRRQVLTASRQQAERDGRWLRPFSLIYAVQHLSLGNSSLTFKVGFPTSVYPDNP